MCDQGKLSFDEFQARMFKMTEKTYGSDILVRKAESIRTQTSDYIEQWKRIMAMPIENQPRDKFKTDPIFNESKDAAKKSSGNVLVTLFNNGDMALSCVVTSSGELAREAGAEYWLHRSATPFTKEELLTKYPVGSYLIPGMPTFYSQRTVAA
jgi:hypothetical protein